MITQVVDGFREESRLDRQQAKELAEQQFQRSNELAERQLKQANELAERQFQQINAFAVSGGAIVVGSGVFSFLDRRSMESRIETSRLEDRREMREEMRAMRNDTNSKYLVTSAITVAAVLGEIFKPG